MNKLLRVSFISLILFNINFACFSMEPNELFDFTEYPENNTFSAKPRSTLLTNEELENAISADGKLCGKDVCSLNLSGCSRITSLLPLRRLVLLEELNISKCTGITDLWPLARLTKLEYIKFSGCIGITDLWSLERLTELKYVNLSGCIGITDLRPLAELTNLEILTLSWCVGVTDLSPLKELEALAELNLTGCTGLIDLSVLSSFKSFFRLNLSGCTGLESISFNNLERVAVLTMDGCRGVISEFPKEVAQLNLRKCRISNSNLSKFIGQRACGHERRLNCLSIIGALPKGLLLLDLSGSRGFKRLPEMAEIGALEAVYLKDCKELKVLPDLSGCNLLSVLDLRGTGVVVGIDEDVVEVAANEENRNTEAVKLLLAAIRERDELAEHARDRDGAPPSAGAVGDFDDGEPAIKKQRRE